MRSARGLWAYLRAGFVIYSHSLYRSTVPPSGQVVVNVWHGMPIKKISAAAHESFVPRFDFTVATAERFVPVLARSFNVAPQHVLVTGLPRNDVLLTATPAQPRFVVYLPTWRAERDRSMSPDDPDPLITGADLDELNSVLVSLGVHAVVKPHPFTAVTAMTAWRRSNITVISDAQLHARGQSLYRLLAASSLLITDYSSVAVDYLLTGRPIILYQPDAQQYRSVRGFNAGLDQWASFGESAASITDVTRLLKILLTDETPPADPSTHPFHDVFQATAADVIVQAMLDRALPVRAPIRTAVTDRLESFAPGRAARLSRLRPDRNCAVPPLAEGDW